LGAVWNLAGALSRTQLGVLKHPFGGEVLLREGDDDGRSGLATGDAEPGIHQFHRPSSRIEAGTMTSRTRVALMAIATAIPTPSCFIGRIPAKANPPKTTTMNSAAPEISGVVPATPRATLSVLSPVFTNSSRTRPSRNTS
jgi:hypothetical protein